MQRFPVRESLPLQNARSAVLLDAVDRALGERCETREHVKALQWRALVKLVNHAYRSVPLYRRKYDAAGFSPEMLRSWEDFARIPMLTKQELRTTVLGDLRSTVDRPARLIASSGSTGVPGRLYRDEESLWRMTAENLILYHDWCGDDQLDGALYFVDFAPDSLDFAIADLLRTLVPEERVLPVTLAAVEMWEKFREFQPRFVSSYPSTMRGIASVMKRAGKTDDNLRLLHLTAEMLDSRTRGLIHAVFPKARIVETYTSSEAGLLGWSCPCGNRLHLAENLGIHETIDGMMAVTDLTNYSTPVIRYGGMQDFCRIVEEPCACGSAMRAIRNLEGRLAESVTLPDGSLLSPFALLNAMEEVDGIEQYQIIQHAVDDIEVLIVRDPARELGDVAGVLPLPVRVTVVRAIKPGPGAHKIPLIVSKL